MKRRILALLGSLSLAAFLMVVALWLPSLGTREPLGVTPASDASVLAMVNDEPVALDVWRQQYLLDQVMSQLSGQPLPTPRETLERLVNDALLLQAYPAVRVATAQDISQHIAQLETAWGFSEALLVAHLEAAGLRREVLTRTVAQLLAVEDAQVQLEVTGADLEAWLRDVRQRASIEIDESLFAELTPPVAPTFTPHPDR